MYGALGTLADLSTLVDVSGTRCAPEWAGKVRTRTDTRMMRTERGRDLGGKHTACDDDLHHGGWVVVRWTDHRHRGERGLPRARILARRASPESVCACRRPRTRENVESEKRPCPGFWDVLTPDETPTLPPDGRMAWLERGGSGMTYKKKDKKTF